MPPVYEWYQQGLALLASGNAHAAATILERAVGEEPDKSSLRETLGRAYYGSGRFSAALDEFARAIDIDPVNDYAYFGAGLCLAKLGRLDEAVGHVRMAAVMRPDVADYSDAASRLDRRRQFRDGAA
jgi:tetratricopeptide (TPR) repeat protein